MPTTLSNNCINLTPVSFHPSLSQAWGGFQAITVCTSYSRVAAKQPSPTLQTRRSALRTHCRHCSAGVRSLEASKFGQVIGKRKDGHPASKVRRRFCEDRPHKKLSIYLLVIRKCSCVWVSADPCRRRGSAPARLHLPCLRLRLTPAPAPLACPARS